jgi:hypothetical protein
VTFLLAPLWMLTIDLGFSLLYYLAWTTFGVSFASLLFPHTVIRSRTLCGQSPAPGKRPAAVTTPLSGWFSCAGERGCGIAVALHVAIELSRYLPVTLLATTGHELGLIGGYEFGMHFDEDSAFIVHIGTCIANRASEMTAVCSAERALAESISATLAPIGIRPRVPGVPGDPRFWIGESKCWAFRNRPMLSIAGLAPHFHTRGDLPERTTSPALLAASLRAIGAAARALAQSVLS